MHKLVSGLVLALLLGSLGFWWLSPDKMPKEIVIATGAAGGLYHQFATDYQEALEEYAGSKVRLRETHGSLENHQLLLNGDVDLAIFQLGSAPEDQELAVLAPLFGEVVHVIAREGRGITSMADLDGKHIAIGPFGSGMQVSAIDVLVTQYRIDAERLHPVHFTELLSDLRLDAAVVTSGISNPQLRYLLATKGFRLLEINSADALATWLPWYRRITIPLGLYSEGPAVPKADLQTIGTTAVLVARYDSPAVLVDASLHALYDHKTVSRQSLMMHEEQASAWNVLPKHAAARAYFTPYEGLERLSQLLESFAAMKELLIAFAAGFYLLWQRWRAIKEEQVRERVEEQLVMLRRLLDETMRIERAVSSSKDIDLLQKNLDELTRIKLRALEQLPYDELREEALFSIFLSQCSDVLSKTQSKIRLLQN